MSYLSKSLNAKQGKEVSELEKFFMIIDNILEKRIEENPKSGMVVNKGTDEEVKMKYKDAQKVLQRIESSYAVKGCNSFGICKTCTSFNSRGSSSGSFGKCEGKDVHCYDTCNKHSEDGGGFGL
jgi:hypothetical protein